MITEKIKQATAHHHHQLEQNPVLRPLSGPTLTLAEYNRVLEKFYGFFAPLEQALKKAVDLTDVLPDFPDRRKAAWLEKDLAVLPHPNAIHGALPLCQNLPQIQSTGQALGCIYVLEGSTLGGRMIARNLQEKLGIDEKNGGAFFRGYGPETGPRWKTFLASLTRYHQAYGEEEAIIEAASDTFLKLDQWLNQA